MFAFGFHAWLPVIEDRRVGAKVLSDFPMIDYYARVSAHIF